MGVARLTSGVAPRADPADPLVVLYDRDCAFCTWTARQLWSMDREHRLEFVPLQVAASSGRPALEQAAADLPLLDALHVVDERYGIAVAGGRAMLAILDALPGGWFFRPWAALPFVPPLVEGTYRVVARNRHTIGRWLGLDASTCVAPPVRRVT
jgi:predicted DCC family thiol-disulfide oxidoreductase YuxK